MIGNTWAWPKSDPGTQIFSRLLGGPIGGYLNPAAKFLRREDPPRGRQAQEAAGGGDGRIPRSVSDDIASRDPERRRWEQLFPDHRTVMLDGAGHYIQEDASEEIIAAVRHWRGGG